MTGHWPFDDLENAHGTREMKELVMHGRRPHINIDSDIRHSDDPYVQAMLQAVELCWKQDPHERPSAREVQAFLEQHLPPSAPLGHPKQKQHDKHATSLVADQNDKHHHGHNMRHT